MIGPLAGGLRYAQVGHAAPDWISALISGGTMMALWLVRPETQSEMTAAEQWSERLQLFAQHGPVAN